MRNKKHVAFIKIKNHSLRLLKSVDRFVNSHPVFIAIITSTAYLLFLQRAFTFSGDVWAETHMEYLNKAITNGYQSIFETGWAGYFSLLPSFFAKLYVVLRLPIGYIDIYYKLLVVIFAIASTAFCASRLHSSLIRNSYLRILLGLSLLLLLNDKSIFTFINIWYTGFIPIILICLSNNKLLPLHQTIYAVFGICVALSKPAIILIPFLLYRVIKTKQYISNLAILGAAMIQTSLMLFFDPRNSGMNATKNIVYITKAVFVGGATETLKLLNIEPRNLLYIFVMNFVLVIALLIIRNRYGITRALLLVLGYVGAVYTYVLAPDAPLFVTANDYSSIYHYSHKTQREFLIFAFILILIFLSVNNFRNIEWLKHSFKKYTFMKFVPISIIVVLMFNLYNPIDSYSAGVRADIGPFRQSLNNGESTCVPLPPTTRYLPHANWYFEHNTICHPRNFELTPNFDNMNISLANSINFIVPNDTKFSLKTIVLVLKNASEKPTLVSLKDIDTGATFSNLVPKHNQESLYYVSINLNPLPPKTSYRLNLSTQSKAIYWGTFSGTSKYIYYPYFGETWTRFVR